METQYINCQVCRTRTDTNDFAVKKGIKLKTCKRCIERSRAHYEASKCEHGKTKCICLECGGASICEHKYQKDHCKQCTDPRKVIIANWLSSSKQADKRRGQDTNITREFCAQIITESQNKCCYCAVELQMLERAANLMTIERIDNRIGHVVGNCRIACFHCNVSRVGDKI